MPRHMSLCTGYGGIDIALAEVFGAETVAVADIDPGACKILAHRYPGVPNLGDITATDWSQWVGKVDVISGGTPCQDLSHAGRRAGMTEGTRSNLWVAMREAIATIRPALVVWENVRGAYSAAADSALEPCPGCVGDPIGGTPLRALGRVLGDLSSLGYDACWYGLRASDVGAAHHRYRVFVFAWPADAASDTGRLINGDNRSDGSDTECGGLAGRASDPQRGPGRGTPAAGSGEVPGRMMPTPTADRDGNTPETHLARKPGRKVVTSLDVVAAHMLPTPMTTDDHNPSAADLNRNSLALRAIGQVLPTPSAYTAERGGAQDPDKRRAGGHTVDLADVAAFLPTVNVENNDNRQSEGYGPNIGEALRSLPTPRVTQAGYANDGRGGRSLDVEARNGGQDWREYEPAIRRQEAAFGRPAPLPTEPGKTGKPRLSSRFSEWLIGCPDGWITDVPGLTRNEALKAAGNGVVPQQCAAAATRFVHDFAALEGQAA